jgi:hypothetical protein
VDNRNLDKLHEVFVAAPDEGDRYFIDKFRDHVKPFGAMTGFMPRARMVSRIRFEE